MKASELKGRAVVTLSDAEKVGQVSDVLFDATYREVLGFRVKKGTFGTTDALTRASVSAVGKDAVTVPGPDVVNTQDRLPDLLGAASLDQAHGTKVVSEGGSLLGTIADVEVDDDVRTVTGYTLSAPLLDRLRGREPRFSAADVKSLGEGGIMIVSNAAADSLQAALHGD